MGISTSRRKSRTRESDLSNPFSYRQFIIQFIMQFHRLIHYEWRMIWWVLHYNVNPKYLLDTGGVLATNLSKASLEDVLPLFSKWSDYLPQQLTTYLVLQSSMPSYIVYHQYTLQQYRHCFHEHGVNSIFEQQALALSWTAEHNTDKDVLMKLFNRIPSPSLEIGVPKGNFGYNQRAQTKGT